LIILGTTVFTIAAIIFSYLTPKVYKSKAFYQISGNQISKNTNLPATIKRQELLQGFGSIENNISVPEYKKYSSLFTIPERFIDFLKEKNILADEELIKVKNKITSADNLSKWIIPVYSYSKEDLDDVAKISEEENSYILGVNLAQENNNPDTSWKLIQGMGEFIKECVVFSKLEDYISTKYNRSATEIKSYENLITDSNFRVKQLSIKKTNIQSILSKYPASSKIENRQVVSIEGEGYRYLSPITQLIGIESNIADIKEKLANYERNKEKAEINFSFFSKIKDYANTNHSGEAIYKRLFSLKKEVFENKDLSQDTVKEVFNQLTIDLENFRTLFFEEMRFIAGPSIPTHPIRPKKPVIVIAGFFIGLFIVIFMVFILEFWHKNRYSILKK